MKNELLRIWYLLTGQPKILVEDIRLNKPEKKWILKSMYRDWVAETNKIYLQEFESRKNREVEFVWSLVGNIVDEHVVGPNKEIKRGTKHFSPGTKVYCFPPQWGDGYDKIRVIGRPRKTSRFIKVIMNSGLITNWRIQKVYSRYIKREMIKNGGWDDSDECKDRIEVLVTSLLEKRGGAQYVV